MPDDLERKLVDKRVVNRYLKKNLVDEKDYEKYLRSLPDLSEQAVPIESDLDADLSDPPAPPAPEPNGAPKEG
ncbi:MAG TPA: hypothetical protein VMG32_08845 [Anaeromyxobacteraceae bacterium]|nr:hypothetical protein [Anaeromyxobacteraceae bacterium]